MHSTWGRSGRRRRGLTLVELLTAGAVMAMVAGALSALALAVQTSHQAAWSKWLVTQHARVALGRIEQAVQSARANEQFPGALVFESNAGTATFPDTLVVWRKTPAPAAPSGLPRWSELSVFCPDPIDPRQLVELSVPWDQSPVPSLADATAWANRLAEIKASSQSRRIVLSDQVQAAAIPPGDLRGAVRFRVTVRPSHEEWQAFRNGELAWQDLAWPAAGAGVRRVWCAVELNMQSRSDNATTEPMPFFGSAAFLSPLQR